MDAWFKEDNIRPFITIHLILIAKDVLENYEKYLSIYKDDIDFNKLDNELNCCTVYKANNPLLLTSRMSELTSMLDALNLKEHIPEIFKHFNNICRQLSILRQVRGLFHASVKNKGINLMNKNDLFCL